MSDDLTKRVMNLCQAFFDLVRGQNANVEDTLKAFATAGIFLCREVNVKPEYFIELAGEIALRTQPEVLAQAEKDRSGGLVQ